MARRFKKNVIIIFIGAAALLIFFIASPVKNKFFGEIESKFVFSFLRPFQDIAAAAEKFFDGLIVGAKYRQEAAALSEKIEKLSYDSVKLRALEKENGELREILRFTEEKGEPKVLANVFRSGTVFSSDFLINYGKSSGVEAGDLAVSPSGVLIGKISEVSEKSAKIMTVTDPRFRAAALVFAASGAGDSASRPAGVIEGSHGTSLKLKFVPQSDKIEVGDTVAARPSIGDPALIFPIGAIKRVETTSRDLFQEAAVEPIGGFFDFDMVMIY